MKKLVSLLLLVAITISMFTVFEVDVRATTTADDKPWTDYAEEIIPNQDGIYEITTPEQLAWVAKMTNETPAENGLPWSLKKEFSLMNSIDISAHQWVPIGTVKGITDRRDNMFVGVFDGNGNVIKGLTIQGKLTNENYQSIGLFGTATSFTRTDSDTEKKYYLNYIGNLFLKDVNIDVESIASNTTFLGSIIGNGQLNLYNCSVSGSIKTKNVLTTGGISGIQWESVTKCVSNINMNVSFDTRKNNSYVGGIIGDLGRGSVSACVSNGEITMNNIVNGGGIVGKTTDTIQTSFSTSKINATSTGAMNVGNLAGIVRASSPSVGKVVKSFVTSDVNSEMDEYGLLEGEPSIDIDTNPLDYMKTNDFINDLRIASESASPSARYTEKFMESFHTDISKFYMVNGLPSSVQPTEYEIQVHANAIIPEPTYIIMIPPTIDFGEQKQALEKYREESIDQYGEAVKVSQTITLSATGVANLFDDLDNGLDDHINVSVTHSNKLVGKKSVQNEVPFILTQKNQELATGANIATFYNDEDLGLDNKPKANRTTAELTMNRTNIKKADSYSGILTFTIAIADRQGGTEE